MTTSSFSLKQMLATVAVFSAFLCLFTILYQSVERSIWQRVRSKDECRPPLAALIERLDKQNVKLKDCQLYRQGGQYLLSCPADETVFSWLKTDLEFRELGLRKTSQVYRFIDAMAGANIVWPQSKLSYPVFYQAVTRSAFDDPARDHFFVVAFEKWQKQLVIWYYSEPSDHGS